MELGDLRREYRLHGLRRADLRGDPLEQFGVWFEQAREAGAVEPNAMSLATAGADGRVSVRTVLLKGADRDGFVFFTNHGSRKARQMEENPQVGLLFPWLLLERQVCVTGSASRVGREETEAYFRSRPLESQLGAWASEQSSVLGSREELEARMAEVKARFGSGEVPVPPFWGGFRVKPATIEFWQGRPNRLHDRFLYVRQAGGDWRIDRLSP